MEDGPNEAMGLRVEQGTEISSLPRVHAWPAMLFPLETSVVEIEAGHGKQRVDRGSIAFLPARARHRVRPISAVAKLVTLLIFPRARKLAEREYRGHVLPERFDELLHTARLLPRTRWTDELVHRYVFERHVCEKHRSAAARFLETEMTKELYFLARESEGERTRATILHEGSDLVRQAREWIEQHLFEALRIGDLAKRFHASESTLLRAFQREIGSTPVEYLRERRLDEALLLLQSGRHSVGEVSARVGYATLPAFTVAFRRRFGEAPSSIRVGKTTVFNLPPHGEPPKPPRRRR